jgi:hypothetical protein
VVALIENGNWKMENGK